VLICSLCKGATGDGVRLAIELVHPVNVSACTVHTAVVVK
jgi:hypothetical protein